jgi:hypothetical protein
MNNNYFAMLIDKHPETCLGILCLIVVWLIIFTWYCISRKKIDQDDTPDQSAAPIPEASYQHDLADSYSGPFQD